MGDFLLLDDDAGPYTSRYTTEGIVKIGYEVLPHPLFSLDVAPSDFSLFEVLKEARRGFHFERQEAAKTSVRQQLKKPDHAFYHTSTGTLVSC
ncbi:hypothetical protein Trydic_g23829 [Trypoxylus dichotomus]